MKKAFLDISNLSSEDLNEIKHLMSALSIEFNEALWVYIDKNPGKVKVLGEMEDGKIIRNEINMNGVKEFNGKEALKRIIDEVIKNKKGESK